MKGALTMPKLLKVEPRDLQKDLLMEQPMERRKVPPMVYIKDQLRVTKKEIH